ncbi:ribosomal RNA processing protein 36 homolog [Ciona intestinalis]
MSESDDQLESDNESNTRNINLDHDDNEMSSEESDNDTTDTEVESSDASENEEPTNETKDDSPQIWQNLAKHKNASLQDMVKMCDQIGAKKVKNEMLSKSYKGAANKQQTFKRENKNRPQEISSKIKVPKIRQVVIVPKSATMTRDPRFDDLCGSEYNEELFQNRYQFLDNIKQRERLQLKKQVKKTKKGTKDQQQLKYLLSRMEQQEIAKKQRMEKREEERKWKKVEMKKVKQGIKRPYYLKNSVKNKMVAELRNKDGAASNKSEIRKEKRQKSKESKVMPYTRRVIGN